MLAVSGRERAGATPGVRRRRPAPVRFPSAKDVHLQPPDRSIQNPQTGAYLAAKYPYLS